MFSLIVPEGWCGISKRRSPAELGVGEWSRKEEVRSREQGVPIQGISEGYTFITAPAQYIPSPFTLHSLPFTLYPSPFTLHPLPRPNDRLIAQSRPVGRAFTLYRSPPLTFPLSFLIIQSISITYTDPDRQNVQHS